MSFVYHLASYNFTPARYVRISGTADAPVIDIQQSINPIATWAPVFAIFSNDGGQTLYLGGDWGLAAADSLAAWKSIDRGVTWTNKSGDFIALNLNPETYSIGGFPENPSVIFGSRAAGGPATQTGWHRLNEVTDKFDIKQQTGDRPYSIWACTQSNIVYGVDGAYPATAAGLFYSLDLGETWALDATAPFTDFAFGSQVVTDPRDGRIYVSERPGTGPQVHWAPAIGGPWTTEAVGPATGQLPHETGRLLCCDETGAVWLQTYNGTLGHQIWRRDPGTGIWALSLQSTTGNNGAIWVKNSTNALSSTGDKLNFWDGTSWTTYTTESLGLGTPPFFDAITFRAIWGEADPDASGGDLAGGPRFRVGYDPERNSGPRQEDGSLQSDMQIVTGVQNIATFDGGTVED